MKKIIIFITAILITSIGFSQSIAHLNGKITNPTGELVYLRQRKLENRKRIDLVLDSAKLSADGSFKMEVELTELTEVLFDDGNEVCPLLLKGGDELYLTLNTKMFDETIVYNGKGAIKNNAIKNLSLMNEVTMDKIWAFDEGVDTTQIYSFLDESFDVITEIIKDYQNDIPEFKKYGDAQLINIEINKGQVKRRIKSNRAFKKIVTALVGTKGIDFKGVDLSGKEISLSDYKGKTVVIDFWSTWCGPCKAEMPAFKALEEKYGDHINFVSIGLYCKQDEWKKMATKLDFKNNIYLNKERKAQIKDWSVSFIPRYIVLDKDFKVVDANAARPSGEMEALLLKLHPELK